MTAALLTLWLNWCLFVQIQDFHIHRFIDHAMRQLISAEAAGAEGGTLGHTRQTIQT